ncbi:MAG TPA: tubulin-like doman-containing protein, partial [Planctomycetota bacterium]|nr:tubulin-like doman-containing protein [Planctomycetota bacterium]
MEERRVPLTLILGLGGTGQLVARHVKALLRRELNTPDFSDVPFVEILVLDTTEQISLGGDTPESAGLSADEFSDLGGFNLQSVLAHREEYPEISWFPRGRYLPGELTLGAGGIRHVGRLCYSIRRDGRMVYGRLSDKIRRLSSPQVEDREFFYFKEVIRPRLRSGLHIHVVASSAGGTGGGMFLPAAYDIRDWAERITGKDPVVTGHLLLPEAFALSEARQLNFRRNAFAVLAEINHFFKTGHWEAQYREEKQVLPMIPFNFCYLLNAGRQDGSLQVREDLAREIGRFIGLMALGKEG